MTYATVPRATLGEMLFQHVSQQVSVSMAPGSGVRLNQEQILRVTAGSRRSHFNLPAAPRCTAGRGNEMTPTVFL